MGDLNATSQIDAIISSYDAISLTIWITLAVILVAVIALGSEFWVNLWGCIVYPSLTFQRLLGEGQWVPGIVVVAISGLSSAMIFLAYISDLRLTEWFSKIDAPNNPILGPIFTNLDSILEQVGWNSKLMDIFHYMQLNPFQATTLAVVIPLVFLIVWLVWGLAGQLGSMLAGNKAGHGVTSLWSAVPYAFLISILSTWLFMVSLYDHPAVRTMFWISVFYFLFEHVVLMREHGRYNISKAVMATIFTLVLVVALSFILIVAGVALAVQAGVYIK
jgi:hypothetical protein